MNLFNRRKDICEEYTVEIKPREGLYKKTHLNNILLGLYEGYSRQGTWTTSLGVSHSKGFAECRTLRMARIACVIV